MSTRSPVSSTRKCACGEVLVSKYAVEPSTGILPQESRARELVQRIVDGRHRDRRLDALGLLEQHFRGHVPVALGEQQPAQRDALARGAQMRRAQPLAKRMDRTAVHRARPSGAFDERQGNLGHVSAHPLNARSGSSRDRASPPYSTSSANRQPRRSRRSAPARFSRPAVLTASPWPRPGEQGAAQRAVR